MSNNTAKIKTIFNNAKKKMSLKSWIIFFVPVDAILIVCLVLLAISNVVSSYDFNEKAYQYYYGNEYTIEAGSKLKIDSEENIKLSLNDQEISVSGLPIYINNNSLVLTEDMIHVDPRTGEYSKVPALSELTYEDGKITVKYGKKSITLTDGFLYNGKNLYITLEDTTLNLNYHTIELSTLAYIEAVYRDYVNLYDPASGYIYYEKSEDTCELNQVSGDYSVNLFVDTMENYKREQFLIYTNTNDLDSVFK